MQKKLFSDPQAAMAWGMDLRARDIEPQVKNIPAAAAIVRQVADSGAARAALIAGGDASRQALAWADGSQWGGRDIGAMAQCLASDADEGCRNGAASLKEAERMIALLERALSAAPRVALEVCPATAPQWELHWDPQDGVRKLDALQSECVALLRELYPDRCLEWARADLSGMTPGRVWAAHPDAVACCLGGSRADVHSGTYGDSGDAWSYDSGRNVHTSTWHLSPAYCAATAGDQTAIRDRLAAERAGRVRAAAEAVDAARAEALRAQGIRAADMTAALVSEAEAKRLRDIGVIRRRWRTIDTQSWRASAARNGGRSGYHPDALALLERIQAAQGQAADIRSSREAEAERAAIAAHRDSRGPTPVAQYARPTSSAPALGALGNAFAALGL